MSAAQMRRKLIKLGAWVLLPTALGWAQAEVPRNLASDRPAIAPESESRVTNVLNGGITLSGGYDDNLLGAATAQTSGFEQSVSPYISLQQRRPRLDVLLGARAGYTRYQHYLDPNQYSVDAAGRLSYSVSRQLRVSLGQKYEVTADPFSTLAGTQSGATPGPLVAPNTSLFLPQTRRTWLSSDVEATYALSRFSVAGVTGNFSQLQFHEPTADLQSLLRDSRVVTASAYYMRRISRHHLVGVQYAHMDLEASQDERTRTDAILLIYGLRFGRSELAVFAGPENNKSSFPLTAGSFTSLPVRQNAWTPSMGATFEWKTRRHALRVDAVRRISDGGGATGAVDMTSGSVSVRSRLSKRLTGDLSLSITDNKELQGLVQQEHIRSGSGTAGVTYQLNPALSVGASYSRIRQTGLENVFGQGDHNRVQLSVDYSFTRPLGR